MRKLVFAFALVSAAAWADTWSGTISDSNCGAKHADASAKSMGCVKKCVGGGASPVFISDGKVIKIANPDSVKDVLGHKVTIEGKLDGDTVTVDKVSATD